MFKLSKPTKQQVIHGVERVVTVFVVAFFGVWQLSSDKFSKTTLWAAGLAGITAVWQLVLSTVTTL